MRRLGMRCGPGSKSGLRSLQQLSGFLFGRAWRHKCRGRGWHGAAVSDHLRELYSLLQM